MRLPGSPLTIVWHVGRVNDGVHTMANRVVGARDTFPRMPGNVSPPIRCDAPIEQRQGDTVVENSGCGNRPTWHASHHASVVGRPTRKDVPENQSHVLLLFVVYDPRSRMVVSGGSASHGYGK